MKITTYKCDKCKKEIDQGKEFFLLLQNGEKTDHMADLCHKCASDVIGSILKKDPPKKEEPKKEPEKEEPKQKKKRGRPPKLSIPMTPLDEEIRALAEELSA